MQSSANSSRATVSTTNGPIKATARMKYTAYSSGSNIHTTAVSSVTSQYHFNHSQRSSLESSFSSLPHKKTVCSSSSSSRAGTNPVSTHDHLQPQQLQQRMIKSTCTDHLTSSANSVSSLSNDTFHWLFDVCPPLCADRLKPIRHETRSVIVRNCAKSNCLRIIVFNC